MKKMNILAFMLISINSLKAQISYTYKPSNSGTSTVGSYSQPSQDQKTITINNKGYNAKLVELYVKDGINWSYLKTIRIPGGETYTFSIGQYEYQFDYGYVVTDAVSKTVASFNSYPLNLY